MGKKVKRFYQYELADIFGEQWEYHAVNPFREKKQVPELDGQIELEDLYNPDILGMESREEYVRRNMNRLPGWGICKKTILSGDLVEIDLYPVPSCRHDIPRAKKQKPSSRSQKNLNNKNRIKQLVRVVCTNFSKHDQIVTLTYPDGYLPDEGRARKDMKNFIDRLRRRRKKKGLPPLKYIYVIEFVPEGTRTKKVRLHHHLIMSGGLSRDEVEETWGMGRCQVRRCQPDDFELTGFAEYIGKLAADKGRHSYASSKNLDKPKVFTSVTKLSRRKFAEIIRAGDERAELLESLYQGRFKYLDSTTYISQDYGGFYLYSRLRRKISVWEGKGMERKGQKSAPDKENALSGSVLPCRAFLEYDWKGGLADGEATYSIVLEAKQGEKTETRKYLGRISGTTKNRAELIIAREALARLKPCCVEFHTRNSYLHTGIALNRFKRQQKEGYRNVKNADLIEKFLLAAKGFKLSAVKEDGNVYTEKMRIARKQKGLSIERDR